jgi:hypothetical protein
LFRNSIRQKAVSRYEQSRRAVTGEARQNNFLADNRLVNGNANLVQERLAGERSEPKGLLTGRFLNDLHMKSQ